MSASTVRRWLNADALKPWQHRWWIFVRDPDFAVKAVRVLTPDDFASLDELAERPRAFQTRYNKAARPFDWRFGRQDLHQLIERIAA